MNGERRQIVTVLSLRLAKCKDVYWFGSRSRHCRLWKFRVELKLLVIT